MLLHVTQMSDLAFFFFDCVEIVVHWNRTFFVVGFSCVGQLSCDCHIVLAVVCITPHIDLRPWL